MKITTRICCVRVTLCLLASGCGSFDKCEASNKQVAVSGADEKSTEGQAVTATTAASNQHGSSYKHVLVSVVDATSGKPVKDAPVTVRYSNFDHEDKVLTDQNGCALLKVNCSTGIEVLTFDVHIVNNQYDQYLGEGADHEVLSKRDARFIPSKPDVVLEVRSRIDEKRRQEKLELTEKEEDQIAEKLFRESPDFWPEHGSDPYPWVTNQVGQRLLKKRWERASTKELGSKDDSNAIRTAVIKHMQNSKAQVREIRWLSPTVVMVRSSWYEGPLAAAWYTYALRKTEAGWIVVTYYMEGIS
jgi:hypothetical protein